MGVALAGDGPDLRDLVDLAGSLGVPMALPGPIYCSDALGLFYDSVALTVVPASVGLTAIQSLAHGVPVISDSEIEGQGPEWEAIRPGVTGDLYKPNDLENLAAVIGVWIDIIAADDGLVDSACRAEVRNNWSPENQALLLHEAVLQEILG